MPASAPTRRQYALGILLVFAATVFWSTAGFFVRLMPELTSWQINGGRSLSMTVCLLVWLASIHGRRLPAVVGEIPKFAFIVIALQFALGSTLYVLALTLAPVANVSCIGATVPVMTAVLAAVTLGEKTSPMTWVAAVLSLAGVAYIVRDGLDTGSFTGNLVAFGAMGCWAIQATVLRGYSAYDLMPALAVGGVLCFLITALIGGVLDVPHSSIPVLALMGLVQLAIPVTLFARGARYVSAVTASLVLLLDALLNPFWAFVGVGEVPPLASAIGGAMIIAGVALNIVSGRRVAAS